MNNQMTLNKKISQLNTPELSENLFKLIDWAYKRCGQTPDENQVKFQISEFIRDKNSRELRNVTLVKLREIFNNGLTHVYGEFFGLNMVTYLKWISLENAKENQARLSQGYTNTNKLIVERQSVSTQVSEEKKLKIENEAIETWNKLSYKSKLINSDLGGVVYDILFKRDLISELPKLFVEKASTSEYNRISKMREISVDVQERNRLSIQLDELIDTPNHIVALAKAMYLIETEKLIK